MSKIDSKTESDTHDEEAGVAVLGEEFEKHARKLAVAPDAASLKGADQAERSQGGEDEEQDLKGGLRDDADKAQAGENPGGDHGDEERVEEKR